MDEYQHFNIADLLLILNRVAEGSKIVIIDDTNMQTCYNHKGE